MSSRKRRIERLFARLKVNLSNAELHYRKSNLRPALECLRRVEMASIGICWIFQEQEEKEKR
jgi:hypothetical protein